MSYFPFTPPPSLEADRYDKVLRSTIPINAHLFPAWISDPSDTKVQGLPFELVLLTYFTSNRSPATAAQFDRVTLYSCCFDESKYCHMRSNLDFSSTELCSIYQLSNQGLLEVTTAPQGSENPSTDSS